MTPDQKQFLQLAAAAAAKAGHIFPEQAACEAALESAFGTTQLATRGNNLFGMKQHQHVEYGTLNLPTHEFLNGQWIPTTAAWVEYPDWQSCFLDRMATLRRLAPVYPHYARALASASGTSYVIEVSATWSTDPQRATKVLNIYDEMAGDWDATAS